MTRDSFSRQRPIDLHVSDDRRRDDVIVVVISFERILRRRLTCLQVRQSSRGPPSTDFQQAILGTIDRREMR